MSQSTATAESVELDERAAYIDGVRQLMTFLEEHPEVLIPATITRDSYFEGEWGIVARIYASILADQKQQIAAVARAMGNAAKSFDGDRFSIHRMFGALRLIAEADRDQVCTKVVTGTRMVTKTVPDPAAPLIEVTETVEDYEYRCEPLLAGDRS